MLQKGGQCMFRVYSFPIPNPNPRAQLLPHDTPGKVGGAPGDAYGLVYGRVAGAVRAKVHAADPVLAEYIMCAGLAESRGGMLLHLLMQIACLQLLVRNGQCWQHGEHTLSGAATWGSIDYYYASVGATEHSTLSGLGS